MNERIKELRKKLGLTQEKFADKVGIKRNTLANYEIGRNKPIDGIIFSICREFNVNEDWLRNGVGEIFIDLTRDEEISSFVGSILSTEDESFKKRFMQILSRLDENDWETLEKIATLMSKKTEQG